MNNQLKVLTVQQASELAGVAKQTIYRWIWAGSLNATETVSGRKNIRIEDLAKAMGLTVEELHANQNSQDE